MSLSEAALCNHNNVQPDASATYLYNHDTIWYANRESGSFRHTKSVSPGVHRVINVTRNEYGTYRFQMQSDDVTGTWYTCAYGWAFVIDTEANVAALFRANALKTVAVQAQRVYEAAYSHVQTLQPPK